MITGVLSIDKPAGMTSHDVVGRVRSLVRQKRVGHAGTLDPDATGVLLVCLGHATRLADLLAEQGKIYDAVLRLGVATTTEDASGEVVETADPSEIARGNIATLLPRFTGEILQVPPMVSAVHHQGQRLYDLARQGITVEREARSIRIDSIDLLDFQPGAEASAHLRVACGKGTYIRTLCADLGAALAVGGHMAALRRTSVGSFEISTATPLDCLTGENAADHVISASDAVSFLPSAALDDRQAADIFLGRPVPLTARVDDNALVRLLHGAELIGVGRVSFARGLILPEKVFPSGSQ